MKPLALLSILDLLLPQLPTYDLRIGASRSDRAGRKEADKRRRSSHVQRLVALAAIFDGAMMR